ncbi:MAG: rhomboid family intramembrane serine protease, partial [Xanthomonadales bacterium]|nr:rhomboid family intramembrane serine protease [Xanthomonadales bacterium]
EGVTIYRSSTREQRNLNGLTTTQPPISIGIIGVCVAIFLMQNVSAALALWPLASGYFEPWQVLSYGFLHGSFNHIFFNMFALWMFGLPIERMWGSRRFATYYFACVAGAGLVQLLVQHLSGEIYPTIGASGAVFGLLLAFGVMFPNQRIFLIFLPVPIKAKWFVLIYGAIELMFGITNAMPQIAHFAHLGGLIVGGAVLWRWGWRPGMTWRM